MQHMSLAGAFDMFSGTVEQLRAHRTMVEKAMARWRTPVLALMFQGWVEVTGEEKDRLHAEAQREAILELKQGLEAERDRSQMMATQEAHRRVEICGRTIKRMFHIQLANAFDAYRDRVAEVQEKRITCQRIIYRMLHTHLAAAFDGFCEAVEQLVAHRRTVAKALSRWQHPVLPKMFDQWVDVVDQVKIHAMLEGHQEAKLALAQEAESHKTLAEKEAQRRMETCKRIVRRILHLELATSFDSFRNRVHEVKSKREQCTKIIVRLLHTQLAAAFDWFCEVLEQLRTHRQTVEKAMARWRTPLLPQMFDLWLVFVEDRRAEVALEAQQLAAQRLADATAGEREQQQNVVDGEVHRRLDMCQKAIARMMHIQLAIAFDSFLERVLAKKERAASCARVIQRMLHLQLAQAFECFAQAVQQLQLHRTVISRTLARWKTPILLWAFGGWLEFVDEKKDEEAQLAHEEAKQQLLQQVREEMQRGADNIKQEAERRLQMCTRTVKRMFHIQLALAFDSLRDRVSECKEKKSTSRRLIFRMLHTQLAAAFDGFAQGTAQLAAQRQLVLKTVARWQVCPRAVYALRDVVCAFSPPESE
jgi:hypothetical protein